MKANFISPCKTLLGIVIRFDKLLTTLLVPLCIGSGKFRYPFAIGFIIALSKLWLNLNVALFNFSKQSLISFGLFLFKVNSPLDPAYALNATKNTQINAIANFLIIISFI